MEKLPPKFARIGRYADQITSAESHQYIAVSAPEPQNQVVVIVHFEEVAFDVVRDAVVVVGN